MVRVITVHNFLGQNVSQIEEPVATCTATSQGREMLLLALSTHCVEVWDLMNSDVKLRTVFPTVDMINQMAHCIKGDYIVTLESKCLRDTTSNNHANRVTSNFVRIYVNWAIAKDQSQPMRARIAGRVTPSLNRPLNSLEMIELPLSIQPTLIACCQSTGNLLVASGNSAILHEFKVETQQVSKIKFIDFEPRPWSLGFTFTPAHIEIVEDFIAIMDSTNLSVFRLTNSMYEDIDQLSSLISTNSSVDKTSISTDSSLVENSNSLGNDDVQGANTKHKTVEQDCQYVTPESSEIVAIHGKSKDKKHKSTKGNTWCKLELGDFHKRKLSSNKNYIDWDYLICNEKDEMQRLVTQGIIDPASQPLTMNFPLISLERAGPGHTVSPFVLNSEDIRIFIKTTSPDEGWSENYTIKNLLCLKINTGNSNTRMDGITEVFKCLVLTPLYMKKECNITGVKKSMLKSDRYRYLQGMSCFVCTTQEGYLYHFSAANNSSLDATCLTTYPFTAPVHHVALEHTQLHALTEAGLETYTLRLSHHIAKLSNCTDSVRATCPSITEPVSLIGLRPFLGIQKLLHTRNYIVLLAKAESSWTMYSLNLPKLENVYFDILNAAKNHKSSSPSTYRHMLGEAHALIRLAKDVSYKSPDNEEFDDATHKNDLKLKNLYNQSCALLADYYIKSDNESDWDMCIPYYKMSGLKPSEVLSRKCTQDAPGLLTFLTDALLTMKSGSEADALFQGYNIIEIICKLEKKDLLKLILGSPVLREYATEKLITLLLTHETDDIVKLVLALLYIQADKQEQAEKALEPVSMQCIKYIVMEHWELLFDITAMKKRNPMIPTFSDFAGILMFIKNTIFAEILIELIEDEDALSLHQIIQVFLEYLPSRVGRDGYNVAATLQVFLEKYLHNYISSKSMTEWPPIVNKSQIRSDFALVEAFKLLVRSYLGKLTQTRVYKIETQENQEENDKENFIFAKYRPNYLSKMPPYAKDYQKILNMNDFKDLAKFNNETEKIIPKELFKLQSVLSCEFLPVECLHEVKQFLDSQNIDGSLSLKTLCIQNTEEVTTILMDDCPQAVVQYAKDKYTKDTEWKYLIELTRDKIDASTTQQELQLLYTQMMKEILNYLPHALPMKSVHRILPRDDMAAFQRCTEMCTKIMHADHVKSLIMETGQQLLTTLKL